MSLKLSAHAANDLYREALDFFALFQHRKYFAHPYGRTCRIICVDTIERDVLRISQKDVVLNQDSL